jgi:2-isopropylmalate synthase
VVGDVAELVEFSVDAITEGINAIGGVTVRLRPNDTLLTHAHPQDEGPRGSRFTGFAAHTDILVATAEAYVSALNSLLRARGGEQRAAVRTPVQGLAQLPAGRSA